jgi:UDP-N-acetylglucosamine 4,6-dehydratase
MIHNWSADPARIKTGQKVPEGFMYTSDRNDEWMSVADLKTWIECNRNKIGLI